MFLGYLFQQSTYSTRELKIFHAWEDRTPYRCGKLIRVLNPFAVSCDLTEDIEKPIKKIFLVGNSHSDALKSTFVLVAKKFSVKVLFSVANNPLMSGSPIHPKDIISHSVTNKIDTIVLHYSPNGIQIDTIKELVKLARDNNIKVSFIMPVPVWDKHIPKVLFNHLEHNESLPTQTQDEYKKANEKLYKNLLNIKPITIYTVDDVLCQPYCRLQDDVGNLYYHDKSHMTITGSKVLQRVFEDVVADVIQ